MVAIYTTHTHLFTCISHHVYVCFVYYVPCTVYTFTFPVTPVYPTPHFILPRLCCCLFDVTLITHVYRRFTALPTEFGYVDNLTICCYVTFIRFCPHVDHSPPITYTHYYWVRFVVLRALFTIASLIPFVYPFVRLHRYRCCYASLHVPVTGYDSHHTPPHPTTCTVPRIYTHHIFCLLHSHLTICSRFDSPHVLVRSRYVPYVPVYAFTALIYVYDSGLPFVPVTRSDLRYLRLVTVRSHVLRYLTRLRCVSRLIFFV